MTRMDDLSGMLPTEAYNKGYRLEWYDSTLLFLKGFEIFRWEYDPSMSEVWDKIKELEV